MDAVSSERIRSKTDRNDRRASKRSTKLLPPRPRPSSRHVFSPLFADEDGQGF
jgi:hypothetical protein